MLDVIGGVAEAFTRLVGAPVSLGFGALLVVHIAAGLVCVITGAIALLSPKQRGRHPRFGDVYFWGLGVVFATATVMAAMRWDQSGYCFLWAAPHSLRVRSATLRASSAGAAGSARTSWA